MKLLETQQFRTEIFQEILSLKKKIYDELIIIVENEQKMIKILSTFMTSIQLFLLKSKIGIRLLHFVILTHLIFLFSCKTNRLYNSNTISKISNLSYEIQNKKISENEIKSRYSKDSLLFLNPSVCSLLLDHYSGNVALQNIFLSCQKLDSIFEAQNHDKLLSEIISDTINQLYYWDQKVRKDVLHFESLYPSHIKDRKIIDSIDAMSMKFINDNKVNLYNLHLNPSIYTNLYVLMIHNLGKERSMDELILNLYLNGFEKGVYSKKDIFSAIMRYLSVSTGKLDFSLEYLFDKVKSTDSYQVKYCKEVIKRILTKKEFYSGTNR